MSKSNRVLASGMVLALVFAAGVTQAAPPARGQNVQAVQSRASSAPRAKPARRLNTVTFTQTIHQATADRGKLQMRNCASHDLGGWAKADGLQVTWGVAEYRSGAQIDGLGNAKPAPTETLDITHAGFRDRSPLATLESVHAGLRRNDIAMESIAIQHEGLPKPQAAFNPKELTVDKSVPWIRNAQPHTDGAVGGDSFNGKYLVQGVTHR